MDAIQKPLSEDLLVEVTDEDQLALDRNVQGGDINDTGTDSSDS